MPSLTCYSVMDFAGKTKRAVGALIEGRLSRFLFTMLSTVVLNKKVHFDEVIFSTSVALNLRVECYSCNHVGEEMWAKAGLQNILTWYETKIFTSDIRETR